MTDSKFKAGRKYWLIFLAPILVFILFMTVLKTIVIPWGSDKALEYLKSYTSKNSPVIVSGRRADVEFFRPTLVVYDIEIEAQKELKSNFSKIQISEIAFQLDIFQIFTGRLQVAAAIVRKPQVKLNVDSWLGHGAKKNQEFNLEEVYKNIAQIPIQRLWVEQLDLQIDSPKNDASIVLKNAYASAGSAWKKLALSLDFEGANITWKNLPPLQLALKTQLFLNSETLELGPTHLSLGKSQINLDGQFESIQKLLTAPQGQANAQIQADLVELGELLKTYLPERHLPALGGIMNSSMQFKMKGLDNIVGDLELETKSVSISEFQLGDAKIRARYKNQEIQFDEVSANHPAGQLKLNKTKIVLHSPWDFESKVNLDYLDLQKLLQSIKLYQVPVELSVRGQADCQGRLENFRVDCQAQMQASKLQVFSDYKKRSQPIVDIPKASADGTVSVDLQKVNYKAQIFLGQDRGQSDGSIEYAKGFKINFQSPSVDFKNIRHISGLSFEGVTPVDGSTEGDSSAATLKIKLRPQNFVFENYQLGTLEGEVSYEKGHLFLNQLAGQIDQTRYLGSIDIDLNQSSIAGALQFPKVDLKDITFAMDRIYHFPLDVQGPGSGEIQFNGPLSFWNLSYELKTQFKNGRISRDSFNDLTAHFISANGHARTEKLILNKGISQLSVQAALSPDKTIDLKASAQNFRLEESEMVTQINTQVYGLLNLTANLRGPVTKPDFELSGTLSETVLSDQEVANSFFSLSMNPRQTLISGTFFGNRIQTELIIPKESTHLPMKIRAKTSDWSYAPILALLSGSQIQNEYETSLNSEVDLNAANGDWNALTGQVKVQKVLLKRGPLYLKNANPLIIDWDAGNMSIKNLLLEGPQNRISAKGGPFSFQNLDFSILGQVELKLFQIFLPFLDDLGGPLEGQATVTGSWDHPKILGSAKLDSSFLKFKGFPHPFEQIQAEVTFSHTKILFPRFKGVLAGGTIQGDGEMQINGIRDVPTSIRFTAEGLNLTVPEKIRSNGNAELTLTGKWFPFVLAGTYRVQSGLFEKEFEEFSSSNLTVQQSPYLPKILSEQAFEPLLLDIQINLEKNVLIKNSMMEGLVSGQLQAKGPPQYPILVGKIETDKNAKITFKDKIFEVQTGQVNFNNPNENNPEIFLSARSRVTDYDISLIVQGLAKNPNLNLTSVPPLAYNDIVSLLALGITSTKLEQNVQSAEQAKQTATEVFGSVLNQTVGRGFQNTTGFNIQVSNSYDSTKNISVPKLTFSRQLSPKTSVQISRLISGSGDNNDVKLQYQLDQNLSAVGSFESRSGQDSTTDKSISKEQQSIFGIDLEFRREFK